MYDKPAGSYMIGAQNPDLLNFDAKVGLGRA